MNSDMFHENRRLSVKKRDQKYRQIFHFANSKYIKSTGDGLSKANDKMAVRKILEISGEHTSPEPLRE